ncbi:MAG: Purine nucleoside phosphoramidase [Candidatus Anoxychlamydiales bacterium]|uniref:HIT domain-containing protein n=1 Tax=marine sediment metagenome TaxID=412755 RepID=A0A0F9K705_9ZZZZ|nr:Purine nucleoside phosphoramidase [Candidatus Anoxychlamydiales bacterium]NGX40390.1 Purine nucleoside phosphoramidase [Candidatus Anoxychlamydiales bacterium]HEU63760.1 histidine triad nucleotide-binding protein [Chlamydiota bacterium]
MATIFEKIINKEIPATILYEDDTVIAIKDKFPKAPVHLLIISKKVIPSFQHIEKNDLPIIGRMIEVSQKLAKEFKVEKAYRLLTNVGESAGQSIFHLHFHLLGGKTLSESEII